MRTTTSSLIVLSSLLLTSASASSLHGSGHVHERHAALDARLSKARHPLLKRSSQVRCPSKVPGAKLLKQPPPALSANALASVLTNAATASYSWELGTYETALLELNAPTLFLYNGTNTIPPTLTSDLESAVSPIFASVDSVLSKKPSGILPFFSDKAIGDPASVGIPFLIRNWTLSEDGVSPSNAYAKAATDQLTYLLEVAPRAYNGAISQRAPPEAVQVWADFNSMAPPFISYYGAITNNQTLVKEGYNQLSHYRDILYDWDANLLKHILLGSGGQDEKHWGTGNGWFVNGALRVVRIIQLSNYASSLQSEQNDLIQWSADILNSVWNNQQSSGAILNYIDSPRSSSSFPDASSTALLAASTFRLAALTFGSSSPPSVNVAAASAARAWVISQVGDDGWLGSVVNPYNWHEEGSKSPEGQSFVLMLEAAYRDWSRTTGGYY